MSWTPSASNALAVGLYPPFGPGTPSTSWSALRLCIWLRMVPGFRSTSSAMSSPLTASSLSRWRFTSAVSIVRWLEVNSMLDIVGNLVIDFLKCDGVNGELQEIELSARRSSILRCRRAGRSATTRLARTNDGLFSPCARWLTYEENGPDHRCTGRLRGEPTRRGHGSVRHQLRRPR